MACAKSPSPHGPPLGVPNMLQDCTTKRRGLGCARPFTLGPSSSPLVQPSSSPFPNTREAELSKQRISARLPIFLPSQHLQACRPFASKGASTYPFRTFRETSRQGHSGRAPSQAASSLQVPLLLPQHLLLSNLHHLLTATASRIAQVERLG